MLTEVPRGPCSSEELNPLGEARSSSLLSAAQKGAPCPTPGPQVSPVTGLQCGLSLPHPPTPYAQVMPCLEVTGLILLLTLVPDPPRGAADKQEEAAMGAGRSSWCEDVRYLGTK